MSEVKRVFLIVLDSFGVGETPDSAEFGDAGANTLRSCFETGRLSVPNMQKQRSIYETVSNCNCFNLFSNVFTSISVLGRSFAVIEALLL